MQNARTSSPDIARRQAWMAVLARAHRAELEALTKNSENNPGYTLPRPTEVGLAMVRGRIGGSGSRFNMGEMTLTRCVVQLEDRTTGVAYIMGRDRQKAELAAVLDAHLQNGTLAPEALDPIESRQRREQEARAAAVASTKVDFFTLVRGED